MKRFLLGVVLVAIGATAQAKKMVVAYVPNWIDVESFVKTIDYKKITHINIAFENPINDEGDLSFDAKNDLIVRAARANRVKVLISIGGGSASGDKVLQARYFSLLTNNKRAGFVSKLADYVVKHQFDGLDVDIEGPSINQDYGAFIDDLSVDMKAKKKLLTSALSKGYGGDKVPDSVFAKFDFVNIMAYDGAGPWQPNAPGQHSSLEFAKHNVKYWLDRGLPRSKAVLGVPFYGYGFGDAFRNGDYPYSKIIEKYAGAELVDQVGSTIWYNGIPTIKAKGQYVVDEKLAGVMIWSLDYDVPGKKSLLSALDSILKGK
jgi:chitinase